MTVRKKIKKKAVGKEFTKDIADFTLPSSEETATPDMPLITEVIPVVTEEETFWSNIKGKIWLFVFGVAIITALVVGWFIYKEGMTKFDIPNQNITTPLSISHEEPLISPVPTPKAVDISKYEIEILNGSGKSGEAAKMKGLLEQEKFIVLSIGNANSSDYQKTLIQAKKSVPEEFLDKLTGWLKKSYLLDEVKELDESEKSAIIIVVGSQKVEEVKPGE